MATKATAKKTTTKARSTTAKTTAKKPATKTTAKTTKTTKPAARKAPAAKAKTTKAKAAEVKSFRLSRETESFISTNITRQTIYWAILATVILVVGILILNAQLEILDTLNQISEEL